MDWLIDQLVADYSRTRMKTEPFLFAGFEFSAAALEFAYRFPTVRKVTILKVMARKSD